MYIYVLTTFFHEPKEKMVNIYSILEKGGGYATLWIGRELRMIFDPQQKITKIAYAHCVGCSYLKGLSHDS